MTSIRRIKIDNNTYELRDARGSQLYVGTCSTAAATNPKVCTVEEFPVDENGKPYVGTEIVVKFDATNTSTSTTPQLNVNGTGAIRIWYNNAVLASTKSAYAGYANRYLHYVYDGTYWVFMGHSVDNNSTYTNVALGQGYAVQNNSAASATITATLGSYALTANGIVSVKFIYDVPANATLNINGKGAKAIYNKDAAITAGVIKSGDTATFIYNTYYHLIAVDSWQDKQDAISDLATIRSGAAAGATALQSYTETDPTVPSWAKASTKPTYTASEVGALPDSTVIPTKVSQLTNDSGFTTNTGTITGITMNGSSKGTSGVVDLGTVLTSHQDISGKADKATTYTKTEMDTALSDKQATLVSGTNLKTVNSTSLLGSGNVSVQPTLVSGTNIKTINNESLLGSGNISIQGGGGSANIEYNSSKTALVIGGGSTKYTIILYDGDMLHPSVKINDFTYSASRFPLEVNSGDILNVVVSMGRGTCTTTMGGTTVSTSKSFSIQSVSGNIEIEVSGPTGPSGPGGDDPIIVH